MISMILLALFIGACLYGTIRLTRPEQDKHVITFHWPYEDQKLLGVAVGKTYYFHGSYYRVTRHVHTHESNAKNTEVLRCVHIYGRKLEQVPPPTTEEMEFESQMLDRQLRRELTAPPEQTRAIENGAPQYSGRGYTGRGVYHDPKHGNIYDGCDCAGCALLRAHTERKKHHK